MQPRPKTMYGNGGRTMLPRSLTHREILLFFVSTLYACGGGGAGGGGDSSTTNLTFNVAGTVNGLAGSGLVLHNNGGGEFAVNANGNFIFVRAVPAGTGYNITIKTQPSNPNQTCTVGNGAGTVGTTDVANVTLSCVNTYAIGGTVTGLSGTGLALQNNGGDHFVVRDNGSFVFASTLFSGGTYNVTVATHPTAPTQSCSVSNGVGTVGSTNIANIAVNCVTVVVPPTSFTISGSVTGLAGSGLVLRNNGIDSLSITGNTAFSFARALTDGSSYNVTVAAAPNNPAQQCTVSNGSGTISGANVTNIAVTCVATFTISGTVRFLSGGGLVLQNNGGDNLPINASGSFTFTTTLASGTNYNITVLTQPTSPSQTCGITNGKGLATGNVSAVLITCTTWTRQLGTATSDFALDITTEANGNLYVTGYTLGSLDGETNSGNPPTSDLAIVKYDSAGTKLWTRQFGNGSGGTLAKGVAADTMGNAYVAGVTGGSLDGSTNTASQDLFVVKYAADGTRLWTRQLGTTAAEEANGISADSNGNVYVTGFTQGNLDGNASAGGTDIFIVKYDTGGTKQWSRLLGGAAPASRPNGPFANESGEGIATDGSGNVYVAGTTDGDLDGNIYAGPNSNGGITADIFVVKYDSRGNKIWTRQLGTTADDRARAITIDSSGNVYITGATHGDLDGNSNAGGINAPFADLFVVKYDSNGTRLWTRQLGTAGDDRAYDIVADVNGSVYVTGTTSRDLDGNSNSADTNGGLSDIFLVKYDTNGNKHWTRQFGSRQGDEGRGVAIDVNGGVYIAGYTFGDLNGSNNGGPDLFVTKYAASDLLQ